MNEDLIQKAASCIMPIRFNIRNVRIGMDEDYDPDLDENQDYGISIMYKMKKHKVACTEEVEEVEEVDSDDRATIIRWYGQAGVRITEPGKEDPESYNLEIELDFVETYRLKAGCEIPDEESLKEFGVYNVRYHVWPYLREMMQSLGERIGVGAIPLPHYAMWEIEKSE